jgi:hypothetical protein
VSGISQISQKTNALKGPLYLKNKLPAGEPGHFQIVRVTLFGEQAVGRKDFIWRVGELLLESSVTTESFLQSPGH